MMIVGILLLVIFVSHVVGGATAVACGGSFSKIKELYK